MDLTIPAVLGSAILGLNVATTNIIIPQTQVLASHEIRLDERVLGGGFMSDTMADNILLNLAYLNNDSIDPKNINWDEIRKSRTISFRLNPSEVFAFHEDTLPEYAERLALTTNARFNYEQGFKHDGYLMGDGVCHLASLINWVAQDANLATYVPRNHDFMSIPGIDKKYGVSIYFTPGSKEANANKNLYVTNTLVSPVEFKFETNEKTLSLEILK